MAKSLRSRWKRKCRAIKRERYAVKELAKLKQMLGIKEEEKVAESEVMESDQVIYLDIKDLKKKKNAQKDQKPAPSEEEEDAEMSSDDEKIEVDGEKGKKIYSTKTFKDQNGQYPVWLHKRKIAKLNKVGKKNAKKRSKRRRR